MDSKPRKRPWFQFHLSTALVFAFTAGGLMWLNCVAATMQVQLPASSPIQSLSISTYGWPYTAHAVINRAKDETHKLDFSENDTAKIKTPNGCAFIEIEPNTIVYWIVDAAVAISILLMVVLAHVKYMQWKYRPIEVKPDEGI